jgi:hypothetical protein
MKKMTFGKVRVLQAQLSAKEAAYDSLRHDFDNLKTDYARLVEQLGNMALGKPFGKFDMGNNDPHAEDPKQADVWYSPGEEDTPDIRLIEDKMAEPTPEAS